MRRRGSPAASLHEQDCINECLIDGPPPPEALCGGNVEITAIPERRHAITGMQYTRLASAHSGIGHAILEQGSFLLGPEQVRVVSQLPSMTGRVVPEFDLF